MANIPTPRSRQKILGEMINTIVAKYDMDSLKVGGPILSLLEAAAQSDLRNSQDIFNLLSAIALDTAQGSSLDKIGNDENAPRKTSVSSSGYVTISDTSFSKISTQIYSGSAAPIVGSNFVIVSDASAFPPSGTVYVGRGTVNAEGPLTYISVTPSSPVSPSFYTLTLDPGTLTTKYHNVNEEVTYGQGGDRTIPGGTIAQTTRSSASDSVQFSTVGSAIIPDGEVEFTNVLVVAMVPGSTGLVPAGTVNDFLISPFLGASVTNPLPLSNALDTETDEVYRERIRDIRKSRTKATATAIVTGVTGASSREDNSRVVSCKLSRGLNNTLFIDSGAGYEENTTGISVETLIDSAVGGEQKFQLTSRPVAKARVVTGNRSPFTSTVTASDAVALGHVAKLAVMVGGVTTEHTFSVSDFANLTNISEHELASSINSDSTIGWVARTISGKLAIEARASSNEDIKVVVASVDEDANSWLLFPTNRIDSLKLYKNDVLLTKDGELASVAGNVQSQWDSMGQPQTLELTVDGTAKTLYSFTDSSFSALTAYPSLSRLNPIAAWIEVINATVPGITATESSGRIVLTSNLGRNDRAEVTISGGTLVTKKMFSAASSFGMTNDYQLDRNLSQVTLSTPLSAGDKLTAGSIYTSAFFDSDQFSAITIASDAKFWLTTDADTIIVPHTATNSSALSVTRSVKPYGALIDFGDLGTAFDDVEIGDQVIFWDPTLIAAGLTGVRRVADVWPGGFSFETGEATPVTGPLAAMSEAGIAIVRSKAQIKSVTLDFATQADYTPYDVATAFATVEGVSATTVNGVVRVYSATTGLNGKIALVARNSQADLFGFPVTDAKTGVDSHYASIQSGDCIGSPVTITRSCGAYNADPVKLTINPGYVPESYGNYLVGRTYGGTPDNGILGLPRYSSNLGFYTPIRENAVGVVTGRTAAPQTRVATDPVFEANPYSITSEDVLSVVFDRDVSKTASLNMFRRLAPTDEIYTTTLTCSDADNTVLGVPQDLGHVFGSDFSWDDWALEMHARTVSHAPLGVTSNKSILWRSKRMGERDGHISVRYDYSRTPSAPLSVVVSDSIGTDMESRANVMLPTGAARVVPMRSTQRVGTAVLNAGGTNVSERYLFWGFEITAAGSSRSALGVVTLVMTLPAGLFSHGLGAGDFVRVETSDPNFPNGNFQLTFADATTIRYNQAGPSVAFAGAGAVTTDTSQYAAGSLTDLVASGVSVNDIVTVSSSCGLPQLYSGTGSSLFPTDKGCGRIVTVASRYVMAHMDNGGAIVPATTVTWSQIDDKDSIAFYPLAAAGRDITSLVASVNALDAKCPVTAKVMGDAMGDTSGVVALASWDEPPLLSTLTYPLTDGIRYVEQGIYLGGPYALQLKGSITNVALTALEADWISEEVSAVPVTVKGISDYLNLKAVSGLSVNGAVSPSDDSRRIQVRTATAGASGSVQIRGGSANSISTTVTDTKHSTNALRVSVPAGGAKGLNDGQWVTITNQRRARKATRFLSTTVLNSTLPTLNGGSERLTFAAPFAAYDELGGATTSAEFQVEKQGKLTALVYTGNALCSFGAAPVEGSWIFVQSPTAGTPVLSQSNRGWFRVIRYHDDSATTGTHTIWLYNPNSVEEVGWCNLFCFSENSILPGDTLTVSTDRWGAKLQGSWEVNAVGGDFVELGVDSWTFTTPTVIDLALSTPAAGWSYAVPTQLTSSYAALVQAYSPAGGVLAKQIWSVLPNQYDDSRVDIKFATEEGYVSVATDSVLAPLDKLGFDTYPVSGLDAYARSTGLISEVNKILYGDERDTTTYPGIAAYGVSIDVRGPRVKRIEVSLAIRTRSRKVYDEVKERVQSAVAAAINRYPTGTSIAISDIVSAAGSVPGVFAVSMVSPAYTSGSDLIPVQPEERPMVLESSDVKVNFVGA